MYKPSKWAKEIIALQEQTGGWGFFHTLSAPRQYPNRKNGALTTEQALRRLLILGCTIDDEPIQKAVDYMSACLTGKKRIPDRREKLHDWDLFTNLMLSTWIRQFTKDNVTANRTANVWADVITSAFSEGGYSHAEYVKAYKEAFGIAPRGGRFVDFVSFYQVSLCAGLFSEETESVVFDYILHYQNGIYYIYDRQLGGTDGSVLPVSFTSRQASRYLGAVEILSNYRNNVGKLRFVADWLEQNKNEHGMWDMGSSVNDKIYFPLSDSWRRQSVREQDCTYRIRKLLNALEPDHKPILRSS